MTVTKTRILNGHITLFPWKIINVKESLTIQETKEQTGDEVELRCVISDIVSVFGGLFTFHIKIFSDENEFQPANMFDILKNAVKERHQPTFTFSQNSKMNDKLKLDILSYISSHKVEFSQFVDQFDPVKDKKGRLLFTYDELNFYSQNLTLILKCLGLINEEDTGKLKIILPIMFRSPTIVTKYKELVTAVDSIAKSTYLQKLEEAFTFKIGIYTYHHENILKSSMLVYAIRAMRRKFVNTCDMFLGNVEKSRVRRIYKEFTGDSTADESEIDARVKLAFDLKDPELITDLWHFNEEKISIYDIF
ncbi:hypothetical protein C1645_831833 [Glomus cerebriforme]|uniref:Uncharacterized protein n=1 Tax=Glomus cerebriforme TaxID=658196 RepID=A0A397SGS3_9GLOM|nr:hypothetical protein C1645_831833 [Glomus cerebriforme]